MPESFGSVQLATRRAVRKLLVSDRTRQTDGLVPELERDCLLRVQLRSALYSAETIPSNVVHSSAHTEPLPQGAM